MSTLSRTQSPRTTPSAERFLRKRRAERRRRWLRIALAVLVAATVGAVVYTAFATPLLGVREVVVVGERTLSAADVLDAAGVEDREPILALDVGAVERRVEDLAAVDDAQVSRRWPFTVRITVDERDAVALVEVDGVLRAVDREGVDYAEVDQPSDSLPVVDVDPRGVDTDARLQAAVDVVLSLPSGLRAEVASVSAVSPDDVRLALRSGAEVRWGSVERAEDKARALEVLLARQASLGEEAGEEAAVYDVRTPDVPTVG